MATSAQPLMIVVPESAQVTAEITIANQDIGFVDAGQIAEVKLETFPYTKYGTVTATVDLVTADAVSGFACTSDYCMSTKDVNSDLGATDCNPSR